MVKSMTVAIVAALFFSAGLIAGYSVRSSRDVDRSEYESATGNADYSEFVPDVSNVATEVDDVSPLMFISNSISSTVPDMRPAELKEPLSNHQSDAHRAAIHNLILRHFPDTAPELAEVWTDTYAEMDLEEIGFVLEQKRNISTSLAPEVDSPVLWESPNGDLLCSRQEPSVKSPVEIVQANLQSAFALGFRRMVVFPEAVNNPASITPNKRRHVLATTFRSFESGTLIQSPVRTHAALAQSGSLMFLLDNNGLTRRGDFRLLKSRRLGLGTYRGELASTASTPIPEEATNIRITAGGIIQFNNAAGETCEAGRITVCSVADPAQLRSNDGVFFEVSDAASLTPLEDVTDVLVTEALEQSNVDRTYEDSLLANLKSL